MQLVKVTVCLLTMAPETEKQNLQLDDVKLKGWWWCLSFSKICGGEGVEEIFIKLKSPAFSVHSNREKARERKQTSPNNERWRLQWRVTRSLTLSAQLDGMFLSCYVLHAFLLLHSEALTWGMRRICCRPSNTVNIHIALSYCNYITCHIMLFQQKMQRWIVI